MALTGGVANQNCIAAAAAVVHVQPFVTGGKQEPTHRPPNDAIATCVVFPYA